ncbi:MAG: uroporphyrinogen-III synthase [Anaerolineales bacterium]|jgi:uroporphyrinogen-III synthase
MSELTGKRIVVTRPLAQADGFAKQLQALGASTIAFPVIEIGQVEDTTSLDRALAKLSCYEWMVMTSVNGVEKVWERLDQLGLEDGFPESVHIAAIGPKTAEALRAHGINPDFVPEEYVAEAIVPGMGDLRDQWVLLPRADIARPALAQTILECGGIAHEIAAYRTLPNRPDARAIQSLMAGVDLLTFTSSSTVRNFDRIVRDAGFDPLNLPGEPLVACIGPITAQTAEAQGFPVAIVATEYTTKGLCHAISRYFSA